MSYRRRRKRYKPRASSSRRYSKKSKKSTKKAVVKSLIPRPLSINTNTLPDTMGVKFKYSEHLNLAPGTTAVSNYTFRINSLFDPNYTGVGSQPRYFDQLCTLNLYTLYFVRGVKYKIKAINKAAHDVQVGLRLSESPTLTGVYTNNSAMNDAKELSNTYVRTLLSAGGSSKSQTTFTGYCPIYNIVATTQLGYYTNRDQYMAGYGSNPAVPCYLIVSTADDPNGSLGSDVDFYIEFHFDTILSELARDVPQS